MDESSKSKRREEMRFMSLKPTASPHSSHSLHGFNLVELLVVIGIIALLISMLLPALARARASAEQSVCVSNLHQLALAGILYSDDNKGYICPASQSSYLADTQTIHGVTGHVSLQWNYSYLLSGRTYYYSWRGGYLGRYLQTDKILQCPSLKIDATPDPTKVDYPATHYGLTYVNAKVITQIRAPAATAMFADIFYYDDTLGFTWPAAISRPSNHTTYSDFHGRHRGRSYNRKSWMAGN